MRHLVEDYGDDVRVIHRSVTVPGFTQGEHASEAAFAAHAQGKFWEMHYRLFEHATDFSRPMLRSHAEAIGLDLAKFTDDLDQGTESAKRARHRRQGLELGVGPLPAAFVNGLFVLGFKDEAGWHALIDSEIARARRMMQDGISRDAIYAELMKSASTSPVRDSDDAKNLRAEARNAKNAVPVKLTTPDGAKRYRVPEDGPGFGPADAPVVVVEFVDAHCPFCRRALAEIVDPITAKYPDDVRVVLMQLPLESHPSAPAAARAVLAAERQGAHWEFHRQIFGGAGGSGREDFLAIAKSLKLDEARFLRDLDDPSTHERVNRDLALSRRLGVLATPGFFVNGRYVDGQIS
jgi:protein-disulfide isomerase